ncbi:MAG TPA: hypothetical protein VK139_02530 [Microbacteriaceae bacterium]|nr:hypothetical protein [Microbacteriaceae bacterium]
MSLHAAMIWAMDATPSPTPTIVDENLVTPGPWGFVATAFIALATIGLIYDAVRRMRRMRYRAEIAAKLDAEEAARNAGDSSPSVPG